jgi:hypothetical protein
MSLNLVLSETNLKKLENTIKPFKIHSNYQWPKVLTIKNNSTKEEEIEKVVLDNKIKKNSLDDKEDIKMKKVGV